jgi:peptide/nickel transport system substrate-binding protein
MTHRFLWFRSALDLAAFSLLLAACGGAAPAAPAGEATAPAAATDAPAAVEPTVVADATEAPTTAAAEPTAAAATTDPKETIVYAGDLSDQISLDPAVAYEFGGILPVGHIYQTLVTLAPGESEVKPLLAKSWDVKDSGDTWTLTFALDENAKFASGNAVTADDVVYSWGRVIDLNKAPAFLFNDVAGLTKESFKAVDPQTLEVTLAKTTSPQVFLSVLSFSVAGVVEKAVVEANAGSDMGSTWLNDHSAGSGPYVLESWERNTQNTLNLNPNYWGTAPAIKRVILRNVTELANLQSAIETGEADIVSGLGSEQVTALEANPDVQIVKGASTALVYIGMNATVPPLDNVDVRQAIRYAINYDDLNTLLGGNGKVTQEIIPEGLLGHTGLNPFTQDIAKAKELLAKAGVAEGTEIEFLIPAGPAPGGIEWSTIAAAIQNNVQQIGLTLTIKQVQQSELLTTYRAQKGQMVLILWGPDYPDPDGNVTPLTNYEAQSIAWRNAWNSPEIGELSKQAAVEQDNAKRVELYKQLTERVLNEGPYAVLYQPTNAYAVRKNISGFVYGPASTPAIWLWTLTKS